jgi:hypothetical protein
MKRCGICGRRMIPSGWFIGPWALWRSVLWRIVRRMDCGGDCLRCVYDAYEAI